MGAKGGAGHGWPGHQQGGLRNTLYEGAEEDRYRVFVSPVGLVPWKWRGMRGEAFFLALLAFVGLMVFGLWIAAFLVPLVILFVCAGLSLWDDYWPEILYRAAFQPVGYLEA